jgi:translocation and assembly module TamB
MKLAMTRHRHPILPILCVIPVCLLLPVFERGTAIGRENFRLEEKQESTERDQKDGGAADSWTLDSRQDRQRHRHQPLQPVAGQNQRQFRYWTTNWTFSEVDVATLAQRLARIGITAPVDLEGKVSVAFSVSIPINALRDATAYRFDGTFTSSRLRINSTELSLNTQVEYIDGIATLNIIQGAVLDLQSRQVPMSRGRFQGEASLRLAGEGERTARVRLALRQLQMPVIAEAISPDGQAPLQIRGTAEGDLQWVAPVESLTDPSTWTADGELSIDNLSVEHQTPLTVKTGPMRISGGILRLPEARIDVVDLPEAGLQADLEVDFRDTQPWSLGLVSNQLPVESVAAVVAGGPLPATRGELSLDLKARGTLTPLDWLVEGTLHTPELLVLGLSLGELNHQLLTDAGQFELQVREQESPVETRLQSIRADYTIAPEAFHLSKFDAELFEGNFQGDLRWARRPDSSHELHLNWTELQWFWDVGSLTTGVPGELSFATEGRVSWQAPFDKIDLPAEQSIRALLSLDEMMLAGQPLGNLSARFRAIEGDLALQGRGDLLGGTFQVDTATSIPEGLGWTTWIDSLTRAEDADLDLPEESQPWDSETGGPGTDGTSSTTRAADTPTLDGDDIRQEVERWGLGEQEGPISGHLELRGISLARAESLARRWLGGGPSGGGQFGGGAGGGQLGGSVDAVVEFDLGETGPDQQLRTVSRVRLTNFSVNRIPITSELLADFRGVGTEWRLDRVRGRYAGGILQATGRGSLADGIRRADLVFSRVEAGRALLPVAADAADWIRGELSGQVRVRGDAFTRLDGTIEGRRVELFGLPIGLVRTGISGLVRSGSWEFRFPNVSTTIARGRVAGHALVRQGHSGRSVGLASEWTVADVDFEQLLRGLGTSSRVGRGNVSGSLSLNGRDIRGVSDLQGRFDGRLGGTTASSIPGWSSIRGFLGPIGGSALTFTDGELRGRILRGSVLVDQLALRSDRLRIAARGSVRMDNLRMDMDTVVATGDFSAPDLILQEVARRVALVSAPPIGLLLTVNRWVSDRVVYLQVGGTPSAAVVRVRPAETLGRNTLRYFLQEVTLGASSVALQPGAP